MILNSPYISGSLTVTSNGTISGSLTVLGGITGAITGSATSASYAISASEASNLQGLGSASFAPASTFNTVSQSYAASSASLSTRVTTNETNISTLTSASASFAVVSSSYAAASGSLSTRVTNVETTASVLTSASSSFATMSGSLSTRVTNLEVTSSTVSQSFASTSGSISGRVTLIEGQYATTGSNNFTGPQFVNQASNAISFTSTASLYTNGGLRVSKDSYVSGTAYFNNVVVYGTSSIQYITSSQVNFGTNIITVNTDTPAVRFGGLAVFDSGSTQLTGSMLWDSEKNNWIYSNPSGSTYNSAMLMNGPRNTGSLGNEQGTTACALMMGQGGDHITSSMIYSYGNATCFYGQSFISSSGAACFAGTITAGGDITSRTSLNAYTLSNIEPYVFLARNSGTNGVGVIRTLDGGALAFDNGATGAEQSTKLSITAGGVACFSNQICANSTGGISGAFRSCTFFGSIDLENTGGDIAGKWNVQSVSGAQIGGSPGSSFGIYSYGASAYRLFINSSGNVGIGTTSPSTALEVSSADLNNIFVTNPTTTGTTTGSGIGFKAYNGTSVAQAAGIILTSNTWSFGTYSANQLSIGSDGTGGLALRTACSAPISFFTGCTTAGLSAERMRITSTGVVGIGTNAPVTDDGNLVVAGCVGTGQGATNTVAQINIWETTSANKSGLWFGSMTNANTGVIGSRTATGNIAFQTYCGAWAERMRIVYNGSVGVGTASPYSNGLSVRGVSDDYSLTVLQQNTNTAGYGFFAGNSGDFSIARLSGGTFSAAALKIQLNTNVACFASTVCSPMFLASGCIGIGTTSPCAVLHVQGTAALQDLLYFCTGASVNTKFVYNIASGADDAFILRRNHTTQGNLCIMSWTYQGYVGIGATTPNSLLHICGAGTGAMLRLQNTSTVSGDQGPLIQFMSANQVGNQNFETGYIQSIWQAEGNAFGMRFATKGVDASQSEKMRITNAGEVLVNTTTAGVGYAAVTRIGSYQGYTSDSNTTTLSTQRTAGFFGVDGGASSNSQGSYTAITANVQWGASNNPGALFRGYQNTTLSVQINYNGNLTNTNNSYGAISDISLKENIVDATPKLNNLLGVKIRNYNLKGDSTKQLGVVAQELEEIFPSMVETNTEGLKSVKYSIFVPMLVKAIQEQQHTICSQAGRIRVLESCLGMS